MDPEARKGLIATYKAGHAAVLEALEGISEDELDVEPSADAWSARKVVHHLADSEMTSAIRLRQLLAEDSPTIQAYDEMEFARRLFYDTRPIQPSLDALRAARLATSDILEQLDDDDWARSGTHEESGPYSVETWLQIYAAHAHDHADQIRRARHGSP